MTDNSKLKSYILVFIVGLGIVAICAVIAAFAYVFSPPTPAPSPTAVKPTSTPAAQYQPEVFPLPTYTPNPARTPSVTPTDRPAPVFPTATPLYVPPIGKPLPDLVISSIGDPICASSNIEETPKNYMKITVRVRNIGDAPTHSFGPFDVGVYILLGQASYSLAEWSDTYGGVIAYPNLTIPNLGPSWDKTFTLALDMKGIKKFGIKAVANDGENPIHEVDRENNTLIKYFSMYCY